MINYIAAYAGTLVVFLAADIAWLSAMVKRVYRPALGNILLAGINLPPSIVFYLLYPVGIVIFAVLPALRSGSASTAIVYGGLFGFFTYATYNLTNFATLRNWTLQLTLVDNAWGTALGALSACGGYFMATKITGAG